MAFVYGWYHFFSKMIANIDLSELSVIQLGTVHTKKIKTSHHISETMTHQALKI